MKPKRNPLRYGVDWHGWLWKCSGDNGFVFTSLWLGRKCPSATYCHEGRWVRVSVKEVVR